MYTEVYIYGNLFVYKACVYIRQMYDSGYIECVTNSILTMVYFTEAAESTYSKGHVRVG